MTPATNDVPILPPGPLRRRVLRPSLLDDLDHRDAHLLATFAVTNGQLVMWAHIWDNNPWVFRGDIERPSEFLGLLVHKAVDWGTPDADAVHRLHRALEALVDAVDLGIPATATTNPADPGGVGAYTNGLLRLYASATVPQRSTLARRLLRTLAGAHDSHMRCPDNVVAALQRAVALGRDADVCFARSVVTHWLRTA